MSDLDIFAAMQEGREPLATYVKTIVGQVHVISLDPFSDKPVEIILSGNNGEHGSFVEIWNNKQQVFFERINSKHFKAGRIAKLERAQVKVEVSPNELTEEEILKLLSERFTTLKNRVEKFTDTAPILRLVNKARELEKSEKIIRYLEEMMSKLEISNYEGS